MIFLYEDKHRNVVAQKSYDFKINMVTSKYFCTYKKPSMNAFFLFEVLWRKNVESPALDWKTLPLRGQMDNILCFAGHMISVATIQICSEAQKRPQTLHK